MRNNPLSIFGFILSILFEKIPNLSPTEVGEDNLISLLTLGLLFLKSFSVLKFYDCLICDKLRGCAFKAV